MPASSNSGEETIFSHPGKALQDYGQVIKDYLTSKDTDFTPAIGVGLLGAAAGGLTTAKRPYETPAQRAMRTVRNAVVGGLLGGIGAQATAFGLGRANAAVEGIDPDKPAPEPGSGIGHSLATRLGLASLYPGKQLWAHYKGQPQLEAIKRLFPEDQLKSLEGTFVAHTPSGPPLKTTAKINIPGQIREAASGTRAVAQDWMSKLRQLGGSRLVDADSMVSIDNTSEALAKHIYRTNPAVSRSFGVDPSLSFLEHKADSVAKLKKYLTSRFHVGADRGPLSPVRALTAIEQRLNPRAFSPSTLSRVGGGVQTAGLSALGYFLPDIMDRIESSARSGGSHLFTPNVPSVNSSSPEDTTSPLLRGYQTDFSGVSNTLGRILGSK